MNISHIISINIPLHHSHRLMKNNNKNVVCTEVCAIDRRTLVFFLLIDTKQEESGVIKWLTFEADIVYRHRLSVFSVNEHRVKRSFITYNNQNMHSMHSFKWWIVLIYFQVRSYFSGLYRMDQ